jgi:hypothetical protein
VIFDETDLGSRPRSRSSSPSGCPHSGSGLAALRERSFRPCPNLVVQKADSADSFGRRKEPEGKGEEA